MLDAKGSRYVKRKRYRRIREDFLFKEESYKIGDACKEVWKQFGNSFKESIIDRALTIALERRGLRVETQKRIDIYFAGEKVGTYVPDKIVNDAILVEIKCKLLLMKEDEKQFWRYLRASNYPLGLLINFGPKRIEIRRRVYDTARNKEKSSV